jgi:hypothetical protein
MASRTDAIGPGGPCPIDDGAVRNLFERRIGT